MDEKNSGEPSWRTAWHPMLVFVMERFAPAGRRISSEFPLNRLPQRVDIVVIEQEGVPVAPARKLRSIFDHLRKHTLIEYKGVTDDLEANDVYVLLAYAFQYMQLSHVVDPEEMCLMFVAERIPSAFVGRIERLRGSFVPVGNGLWQGELAGLLLRGVELADAYKTSPSERNLYLFTRAFLEDHRALVRNNELDREDLMVYQMLTRHMQQLRKDPRTMDLKDLDLATLSMEDVYGIFAAQASVDMRLAGLTPEQRLAGLTPEERLGGLTPEERLAGLTPEQLVARFTPEELEQLAKQKREKQG